MRRNGTYPKELSHLVLAQTCPFLSSQMISASVVVFLFFYPRLFTLDPEASIFPAMQWRI